MTRFLRKFIDDMDDARNKVTGYVPHTAPLAVEEVLHGDRLILLFLGLISVITVIPKYYRNTMMA